VNTGGVRATQAAFYAALVLFAGATAAVLSHVAIDVAGDFLLAHDTYDGMPHDSRALFGGIAVALAAIVLLRFAWEALDRRSGSLFALLGRLREARGASSPAFVALVTAVATIALMAMEYVDLRLAGAHVGGVAGLFGGSLLLGPGTTFAVAVGVGWIVRALLGALSSWQPALCALLDRLLPRAYPDRARVQYAGLTLSSTLDGACRLARRGGKRAPPYAPANASLH
jgi:hypothetical protein